MPLYLMLGNMNVATRAQLSEDAAMISRAANSIGNDQARFLTSYASLGRFDYVLIAEADSDAEVAQLSLQMSNITGLSLETVPIISADQLDATGRPEPVIPTPPNLQSGGTSDPPRDQQDYMHHRLYE